MTSPNHTPHPQFDLAIPVELPIAEKVEAIRDALAEHQVVIVCGATGSGKTTQLPKICLQMGRGLKARIGHTQPRRLAARAVADRVASELGTTLGEGVGFRVRFADQTGPNCRVKLMTDGILLQELKSDPQLRQYDTLILDEAHERSLNIDFLLGVIKRLLGRRPDLKLIVTSATIDPERFAEYFGGAPIIEVSGRGYPIEMRYAPAPERPLATNVCAAVQSLLHDGDGDILVFLPGERDIREADKALRGAGLARELDVLPLYARLSATRQAKVFAPGAKRRVVLTTNVAETSLTVPRIRYVIDSGLARIGRYSHKSKMQRLPIEPVARANLDQRAGRCGRLGPGVCVRLFDEQDALERPAFEAPEIQRSNLAGVILQMAHVRLGRIESFDFMNPPDERLIKDGYSVLRELGALDDDDDITSIGKRMAALPVGPRLARALLAAEKFQCLDEALIVVSSLAVPDVRERDDGPKPAFVDSRSDWNTRLNLWRALHGIKGASAQRRWCKDVGVSWPRVLEWRDVQRQLRSVCRDGRFKVNTRKADSPALHRALLAGFVSHIGEKLDARTYRGARGRTFSIFPGSGVAQSAPPWIVATEMIETSRVFGHGVATVKPGWILEAADHLVRREPFDPLWSAAQGRATARQRAIVFGLAIELRQRVPLAPLDPPGARALMISHLLVDPSTDGRGGVATLPLTQHNRNMIDRARGCESRLRRLLIDEAALFRFFDQRVPRKVVDQRSFLSWYKGLDRHGRQALELAEDDVGLDEWPGANHYPESFEVGRNQLPLRYVFAPTTDTDGVTLAMPQSLLGQLGDGAVQWLVPGWLPEKVDKLMRALPKAQRKRLAPIAQTAQAFLRQALDDQGRVPPRSLHRTLAEFVSAQLGQKITSSAFAQANLPDYLNARIELLDDKGNVRDAARSVAALKARHGVKTRAVAVPSSGWHRDAVAAWDFGDLPAHVEATQGKLVVGGRPGLVVEGAGLALRVFADAAHADASHAAGVAALVLQGLPDKRRYIQKQLPGAAKLRLLFAAIGDTDVLLDDVARAAVQELATEPLAKVRTQAAFEALVERARSRVIPAAQKLTAMLEKVLVSRAEVMRQLDAGPASAHPDVVADIRSQLEHLMSPRLVRDIPPDWLAHLPRFLQAVSRRLERLVQQGRENVAHREQVARYWQRYLLVDDDALRQRLTDYRWLLEEYRVSLFSQPVKTSRPVSAKRLDKAWEQAQLH